MDYRTVLSAPKCFRELQFMYSSCLNNLVPEELIEDRIDATISQAN
jgi:hypothetical protein